MEVVLNLKFVYGYIKNIVFARILSQTRNLLSCFLDTHRSKNIIVQIRYHIDVDFIVDKYRCIFFSCIFIKLKSNKFLIPYFPSKNDRYISCEKFYCFYQLESLNTVLFSTWGYGGGDTSDKFMARDLLRNSKLTYKDINKREKWLSTHALYHYRFITHEEPTSECCDKKKTKDRYQWWINQTNYAT